MKPIFDFQMHMPRLNKKFADYLRGKSVAIVGRSGIHDIEQGEFIDSHDIVVRIHQIVPYSPSDAEVRDNLGNPGNNPTVASMMVPQKWQTFIGQRVNVLYHRIRRAPENGFWGTSPNIFRASGGRFLCNASTGGQHLWEDAGAQAHFQVQYVSWELKSALQLAFRKPPLGSTICIADVLGHNIDSAYLIGFLCYFDREFSFPSIWKNTTPSVEDLRFISNLANDDRVIVDARMQMLFDKVIRH